MKIEEAKEKLHWLAFKDLNTKPDSLRLQDVFEIINQIELDQPKPVVPKFVADGYEEIKDEFYLNLHYLAWELIENLNEDDFVPEKALDSDFKRWYFKNETAAQTLNNMHQFGYTVEKEKLYNVKVLGCTLFKMTSDNHVRYKLIGENETPSESKISSYKFEADLTEKEIKEADERLLQWAEEVTE